MSFIKFLTVFMTFSIIHLHASNTAKQIEGGVELTGTGKVKVIISDVPKFTVPETCEGNLLLCYTAERTSDESEPFRNVDQRCPVGGCSIYLSPQSKESSVAVLLENNRGNVIGTFDKDSVKVCPLKISKNHLNFDVIELPKCSVIINGASLPKSGSKDKKKDEEADDEVTDAPESKKGTNWILIGCGAAVTLVIVVGFFAFMGYCANRCEKKKYAQKPKPSQKSTRPPAAATPPAIIATSPSVQPTSPAALPTVSPCTPKTPAKSPAETTKQEAEDKPKTVFVQKPTPPPVTPSKAVKTPEAEPYDVNRAIENAAKSLQANGLLKFRGSAVLKEIQRHYNTKPHRQSTIDELEFFLLIVSQAYIEVHGFLKRARQFLCQNGAVFERGQWRSFNKTTRRYIAKASTPGYVCWYAFACEYGGEIQISNEVKAEAIFEKLSAPALLTVFFREDLKDQIRRSVYAHMRRIHDSFSEMKLYSLPFPLCLLADMKKKDEKAFNESANDKTYSTPLEQINQRFKDDTTVDGRDPSVPHGWQRAAEDGQHGSTGIPNISDNNCENGITEAWTEERRSVTVSLLIQIKFLYYQNRTNFAYGKGIIIQ